MVKIANAGRALLSGFRDVRRRAEGTIKSMSLVEDASISARLRQPENNRSGILYMKEKMKTKIQGARTLMLAIRTRKYCVIIS